MNNDIERERISFLWGASRMVLYIGSYGQVSEVLIGLMSHKAYLIYNSAFFLFFFCFLGLSSFSYFAIQHLLRILDCLPISISELMARGFSDYMHAFLLLV